MKLISILFSVFTLILSCTTAALAHQSHALEFLNTDKDSNLPFSEAVRVENTLYLSGQLGYDYQEKKLIEGGIEPEAKQTMENIKAVLEKYGYKMSHIVKCTVMLADISEWATFNEVYKPYFTKGRYPARSAFAGNQLALNARVEVECIAFKK